MARQVGILERLIRHQSNNLLTSHYFQMGLQITQAMCILQIHLRDSKGLQEAPFYPSRGYVVQD